MKRSSNRRYPQTVRHVVGPAMARARSLRLEQRGFTRARRSFETSGAAGVAVSTERWNEVGFYLRATPRRDLARRHLERTFARTMRSGFNRRAVRSTSEAS